MSPDAFLDKLLPAARACQEAHGIPASFTLAQAALETGWGSRARGNNLFGVKADPSWHGPVMLVSTHEVSGGKSMPEIDRFRLYTSWDECVADRAQFFLDNPRYAPCFTETTGEGWARAVAAAGYATDPAYADKLIAIIHGRNLFRFDTTKATP